MPHQPYLKTLTWSKEEWCSCKFAAGSFHTTKLCSRLFSTEVEFYWQKQQNRFLCHPLGDLGVTYMVCLWLVGKRVVDFLLVLIECFSPALTVEALWADIGRNCVIRKGDGLGGRVVAHPRLLASENHSPWVITTHEALFAWSYVSLFWYNTGMWQTHL